MTHNHSTGNPSNNSNQRNESSDKSNDERPGNSTNNSLSRDKWCIDCIYFGIQAPKKMSIQCEHSWTIYDIFRNIFDQERHYVNPADFSLIEFWVLNKKFNGDPQNLARKISDLGIRDGTQLFFVFRPLQSSSIVTDEDQNREIPLVWSLGQANFQYNCTKKSTVQDLLGQIRSQIEMNVNGEHLQIFIANRVVDLKKKTTNLFDLGINKDSHIFVNLSEKARLTTGNKSLTTLLIEIPTIDATWDTFIQRTISTNTTVKQLKTMISRYKLLDGKISGENIRLHFEDKSVKTSCSENETLKNLGISPICRVRVEFSTSFTITQVKTEKSTQTTDPDNHHRSTRKALRPKLPRPTIDRASPPFRKTLIAFENIVNTCYLNSALQCLIHIPQLSSYFLQALREAPKDEEGADQNPFDFYGNITGAYAGIIWNAWQQEKKVIAPTRLRKAVAGENPRFNTNDQQDSQEFLNCLIKGMEKELKKESDSNESTIIQNLFNGTMQSSTICQTCQEDLKMKNNFSFLSVAIVPRTRNFEVKYIPLYKNYPADVRKITVKVNGTIVDLLKELNKIRSLFKQRLLIYSSEKQEEQYKLDTPLSTIVVDKITVEQIGDDYSFCLNKASNEPPRTLIDCLRDYIQPEVFNGTWHCNKCEKSTTAVKKLAFHFLPPVLIIQLKRFTLDNHGDKIKLGTFVEYPVDGLDLNTLVEIGSDSKEFVYDLVAVSNHMGYRQSGHYTAVARQGVKDYWYEFDDSWVHRVYYTNQIVTANAYLLIYVKRPRK